MKRILTFIICCAAALFMLCACGKKEESSSYSMTKADTYQETLESLIASMIDGDGAQYISLQYPDALMGIMQRDGKFDSTASSADDFLKQFKSAYESELGAPVTAAITGDVSATELTEEQKTAAADYFKYLASEQGYDLKKLDISEAYELSFTIEYTGSNSTAQSPETWCAVNVGNGGWKIIIVSAEQLVSPVAVVQ